MVVDVAGAREGAGEDEPEEREKRPDVCAEEKRCRAHTNLDIVCFILARVDGVCGDG